MAQLNVSQFQTVQIYQEKIAKNFGAKGLAWCKYKDNQFTGGISKFIDDEEKQKLIGKLNLENNAIILFIADNYNIVCKSLAAVRIDLGKKLNLIKKDLWKFVWITDYPMFSWNEDSQKWETMHHMFTMPHEKDIQDMENDPSKVKAQLYDLVLNGVELCSGSIRIHRKDIQEKIFNIIGLGGKELDQKFGFFLNALEYGAPPHGGIAPGFDRIIMMLCGEENIRNVIAFPKTLQAAGLMEECPTIISDEQLQDLGLAVVKKSE